MKMKVHVLFLLSIWKKQKMNFFYEHEHINKIKLF